MAQNLVYFVQQEQQPTMPAEVAQLMSALSGQPVQMPPLTQQTPLLQQVPPPTTQQQPDTTPPHPTDEPTRAEGMEMGVQEKEVGQSNEQMDDGAGVHGSGSKGPTGDAEET